MECVPCGDPPPPYEPHCKCSSPPVGVKLTFCFRMFKLKVWQKNVDDVAKNSLHDYCYTYFSFFC